MAVMLVTACTPGIALSAAAPAGGGQGLEISPPVMELTADPGQSVTANIRLRNVTSGRLVVSGQANDFAAKGEDGEPEILLDEKEASRFSLKYWIPSVPGFSLAPQEVKTAQVQIRVPANAEPGGHYGVIRFTGVPPELEGTGVSLSASIGTLVLMRVSGEISEKLSVADFTVSRLGQRGTFFESGPIKVTERLKNEGSVHVKPVGDVVVTDMFGKQVAKLPIANPARNVLPDSVRKFEQDLPQKNLIGKYTATFTAAYGNGKTLEGGKVTFWVVPAKKLIVGFIALLLLVLLLRYAVRRYNRYIIKQAGHK